MLSLFLIAASICCTGYFLVKKHRQENKPEFSGTEGMGQSDVNFITALAEYECDGWRMMVGTKDRMTQGQWDNTLNVLTENIGAIQRVR